MKNTEQISKKKNIFLFLVILIINVNCSPPLPVYEDGHLYIQYGCASVCDSDRSKMEDKCFLLLLSLFKSTSEKNLSTQELEDRKKNNDNVLAGYSFCMLQASELASWPRDKLF